MNSRFFLEKLTLTLSVFSSLAVISSAEVEVLPDSSFTWDEIHGPIEESGIVPDNLSTEEGATAFAIDVGHNPPHSIPGLNNGMYGNSNSWIGVESREIDIGDDIVESTFAGIDFAGTGLYHITSFAFGRSNLGDEFADRTQGTYYVQVTETPDPDVDTPDEDWKTLGSLEISSSSFPDTYRHLYTLDSAVPATGLRVVTPGPGTCIDEIEVYGGGSALQLVVEGGTFAPNNLAPTGTAFAKDLINDGGFAVHQIAHVNDVTYGNSNSWIGNSEESFVGIGFASAVELQSLAFGRDNGGEPNEFTDRSAGEYIIQTTEVVNPDKTTPDEEWTTLVTLDYTKTGGLLTLPHLRHGYNFALIEVTGIRIITPGNGIGSGAAIDEIELYEQPLRSQPVLAFEGGEFVDGNLAKGATPFSSGDLGPELGIDFHVAANLNDQEYGNGRSWIGNGPGAFGGVNLGATPVTVQSFTFGRDNLGELSDRSLGEYTVQVTTVPNPNAETPDESWTTLGVYTYVAGDPANPALRHAFNLREPIGITGLRIITPGSGLASGAAIDEIEIYPFQLKDTPPPPEPEIISGEGFAIAPWDGNDGLFFDPVPPVDDGSIVPDNIALASNGATPIGSSELGPELGIDFHLIENVNDGLYGNSNSWISASAEEREKAFIGVALAESSQITRIAWGRDNGNGEVDDSDGGTDACGGQCDDRSLGLYTLQITTVPDPDADTPDDDWKTIGTIEYKQKGDDKVGELFTPYLRHEYTIANADGSPIGATGVRLLVPQAGLGGGTAVDELEVFAASGVIIQDDIQDGPNFGGLAHNNQGLNSAQNEEDDPVEPGINNNTYSWGDANDQYTWTPNLTGKFEVATSWGTSSNHSGSVDYFFDPDGDGGQDEFEIEGAQDVRHNTFANTQDGDSIEGGMTAWSGWFELGTYDLTAESVFRAQGEASGAIAPEAISVAMWRFQPPLVIGPEDLFEITSIEYNQAAAEVSFTWNSKVGVTYVTEFTDDLVDWTELDDGIEGAVGNSTTYTETDVPPDDSERYYRVRVLE
ncbi:MAG: hypothetical protein O3C21_16785 [Verrucomicrobia bacterium]|nr:hypothetical protein [Verrucomicrobiota bacterium]